MEIDQTRTLDLVTSHGARRGSLLSVPELDERGSEDTRSLGPSASQGSPPAAASDEHELGQGDQVGRYLVLGRLGRGGMGVVYKAYDPQLDRNVALKLLRSRSNSPDAGRRLLREARTLAQLRHPNVVDVYDTGLTHHGVFIAMELLEGDDVRRWLKQRPRRMAEILRVFREAGRGLLAAHEAGFIHRDFKPANVFVGADDSVRVLDFGLAHSMEGPASTSPVERIETLEESAVPRDASTSSVKSWTSGTREVFTTEEGTVVGTPAFMAPEQLALGHSDHRSEQYAFAMSLYTCLYGRSPPGGRSYESRLAAVTRGQAFPEAELRRSASGERVPARVRRALLRAMELVPINRFESMRELLHQLEPPAPRWRGPVAALTLALSFGAGAAASSADEPAPCRESATALESAWGEPQREALGVAFSRAGRDSLRGAVQTHLDDYAASWTQMYERSCRATFIEHRQSERLFDQRMRCLDRRRNRLHAAVDSMVSAHDPAELTARMVVPYRLPPLEPCEDLEALAEERPLPDDGEARQRVLAVHRWLDEAETSLHAGEYPVGIELARAAVSEAEWLDHAPTLAEAQGLLGRLLVAGGSAAEAERALQRAIEVGAQVRDLRVVATSWVELLFAIGRQGRIDEAQLLEMPARASVAMAGDEVVHAWLLNNLAFVYSEDDQSGRAIEALGQALEIKRAALGERHVDVGISWYNLGNARLDDGQLEEAAQAFEHAQEIYAATVGQEHPLSHFARSGQGRVELRRGHPEVAVSLCQEVLAYFEQEPPSAMWTSRVTFTLARAQWALGQQAQARKSAQRAWQRIASENPKAAERIERWQADPDAFTDD